GLLDDRLHQGPAAVGHRTARRRRRVPEGLPAVRGDCLLEGPGRQERHQGRRRARAGRRILDGRGVHRHVQRRRQGLRRRHQTRTGILHAGARRSESEAQAQRQQLRRRLGGREVSTRSRAQQRNQPARRERTRTPAGHRAGLHPVRSAGGLAMIALAAREFHLFQAAGRDFLYLVPSAAVFALDKVTSAVLRTVVEEKRTEDAVADALAGRFDPTVIHEAIGDLIAARAIGYLHEPEARTPRVLPLIPETAAGSARTGVIPLTTMVMNVTNQCNLACTYCYEYGEDKIVDTEHGKKPKFMSEQTARESVDFLLQESGRVAHLTFF